jgi:Big-like domain-containing protein
MRSTHVIMGAVSLALAGCARLVPPDSIVALEGPQQVNVMVGATQPIKLIGTRGDGQTVRLAARTLRFSSTNPSVAKVTPDGRVQGVRMGRASISATLSTPVGPVSVSGIPVSVGVLVAGTGK